MDSSNIPIKSRFFKPLLQTCGFWKSIDTGRLLHNHIIKTNGGRNPDGFLGNCLIRMYMDCSCFEDARKVLDKMPDKSMNSWGIMVSNYANLGLFQEAIDIVSEMRLAGFVPDCVVFASLLQACLTPSELEICKQVHSYVIRAGFVPDASIDYELIRAYAECGCLESSVLLFDRMPARDAASCTNLMVGYTRAGKQVEALAVLERMMREGVELDQFVFSSALKACSCLEDRKAGMQIHAFIVKLGLDSDVSSGPPIVDFYAKFGDMVHARLAFDKILQPNDVAWSAIISAYCQFGMFEDCLKIFRHLRKRDVAMNPSIYTNLFQVSASLADPNSGTQLHADAIKRGLVSKLYGESALVTMYSRSGDLEYACRAFDLIGKADTVAWTALITGCAYHGRALEALRLFKKMISCGVKPNAITFIGILTAYSHSGLVLEATECLDTMNSVYGVKPTNDHYNSMIDVYCRAGQLEKAFSLIKSGLFEPDALSWKILLGGCATHGNADLGKIAEKWAEAALVRKTMNERRIRKEVSCSWIRVEGKLHRFVVGDQHHSMTEQIYSKLDELESSVRQCRQVHLRDERSNTVHEERGEQLLDHSERLAIAFGLISMPGDHPILIFKNLRVCGDCHWFTKAVSSITRAGNCRQGFKQISSLQRWELFL
ncbi:TPR-like protein [Dioscorea alata]|uniref:TPR-like protein n=1 Tax=Dioscorea alata TaxID=55571 RepID=A0ACB7V9F1_DIOAL|nr:TPR-like protein [Dioscorea alata]